MNEDKFIENLIIEMKKIFPTREEYLTDKAGTIQFQKEIHEFRLETESSFKEINVKLDELKSSANALDKLLEQYPMERIKHLEKHTKIPPFMLTIR